MVKADMVRECMVKVVMEVTRVITNGRQLAREVRKDMCLVDGETNQVTLTEALITEGEFRARVL